MQKLGLDYESLSKANPALIMVSGSVYGQTGPLAQSWGVDGTGAALSGRTYLTGWPDRDPVIPGAVPYGDVIVPYVMAAAVAAALQHRRETGRGSHIDASMYEICVQQMRDAVLETQTGVRAQRKGNSDPRIFHQGVYAVQGEDRWIALVLATVDDWQNLRRFANISDAADSVARDAAIEAWSRNLDGKVLVDELQRAGIAAGVVQDIEDLVDLDPQLAARGSLLPLRHPVLGTFGHLRTPLTLSGHQLRPYRAPSIGEHSLSIAQEICGLQPAYISELILRGVFQ
jgi:crotonobetainyl-CoA:carnitine CoA-transferase CaiB-like acyl-CoA transferase